MTDEKLRKALDRFQKAVGDFDYNPYDEYYKTELVASRAHIEQLFEQARLRLNEGAGA